jgi:hypothetical protein
VGRVRAVGYAARLVVRPECGWGDSQGCHQEAIQERARRREGAVTKASGQSLRPLAPTARGDQVAQPLFTQRRGTEILRSPQHQATPYIRRMSVAPSLATIYACSLLCNECGGANESPLLVVSIPNPAPRWCSVSGGYCPRSKMQGDRTRAGERVWRRICRKTGSISGWPCISRKATEVYKALTIEAIDDQDVERIFVPWPSIRYVELLWEPASSESQSGRA